MTSTRIGLLLLLVSGAAQAQQFGDPNGLYYFRGSAQATKQWFQVQSNDAGETFAITDFQGRGFATTFSDGKALQIGPNRINIQAQSGQSAAELFRVVNTDSDFPLTEDHFVPPHPIFEGPWDIEEFSLDPITGEVLPQFDGSLIFIDVFDLSVDGEGLRFADSLATYFQGPMSSGTEGSFRRVRQLGGAIDPDDAIRLVWGDLQFTRSGCNGGQLGYTSMREGFGTGTLQPARLGSILDLPCSD